MLIQGDVIDVDILIHIFGEKMTIHFQAETFDEVSPEAIVQAWIKHGKKVPPVYATLTLGDNVAFNCWRYLGFMDRYTIDEFCSGINDEEERTKFKAILEKVVELSKTI